MNIPRPVLIGGGALAFALAVVAMVPPTKPIGGAKIDPAAHHGLADLPAATPAAPPPSPTPPVQPQPAPQGYSGDAARIASSQDDPTADDGDSDDDAPSPPRAVQRAQPDPRYAYRDDDVRGEASDQDYRAGYRWAAQRDIQRPRDCRALPDGPGADGCLGYVRDARDRSDDRDGDDSAPRP